jgi:hypothetical protein
MEAFMTPKDPAYWPAIDVSALSSEDWLAFKERVIREADAERARTIGASLGRLIALCRGAPVALSPNDPAGAPLAAKPR